MPAPLDWAEVESSPWFNDLTPSEKSATHLEWRDTVLSEQEDLDDDTKVKLLALSESRAKTLAGQPQDPEPLKTFYAEREKRNAEVSQGYEAFTRGEIEDDPEFAALDETFKGRRDAALVRGGLYINPALVLDKDKYEAAVKASDAPMSEKALALSQFQGRNEQASETLANTLSYTDEDFRKFASEGYNQGKTNSQVVNEWKAKQKLPDGIFGSILGAGRQAKLGFSGGLAGLERAVGGIGMALGVGGEQYAAESGQEAASFAARREMAGGAPIIGEVAEGATSLIPTLAVGAVGAALSPTPASPAAVPVTLAAGAAARGMISKALTSLAAGAVTGGLQSAGSTVADAFEMYKLRGDTDADAIGKARVDGAVSGITTGAVTGLFGALGNKLGAGGGIETLFRRKASETLGQLGEKEVKNAFVTAAKSVLGNASEEAIEEGTDQLLQGLYEAATRSPDKDFRSILEETAHAAKIGGILGGGFQALKEGLSFKSMVETAKTDPNLGDPTLNAAIAQGLVDEKQFEQDAEMALEATVNSNPAVQGAVNAANLVRAAAVSAADNNAPLVADQLAQIKAQTDDLARAKADEVRTQVGVEVTALEGQTSGLYDLGEADADADLLKGIPPVAAQQLQAAGAPPKAVGLEEVAPATAATIQPQPVETQQNAPQIRKIEQGDLQQYPTGDEVRTTPEAGYRNRPVEGGQIQPAQEEVTPVSPVEAGVEPTTASLPVTEPLTPGGVGTVPAPVETKVARVKRAPSLPPLPDDRTDVLDYVKDIGGILFVPKEKRRPKTAEADFYKNPGLSLPWRNQVFAATGQTVDVVAQRAFNNGFIDAPTAESLKQAMGESVAQREKLRDQRKNKLPDEQTQYVNDQEQQAIAFEEATKKSEGKERVFVSDLEVGDKMLVDGEEVTVSGLNYDEEGNTTSVQLSSGIRFGKQSVYVGDNNDNALFVDELTRAPEEPMSDFLDGQDMDEEAPAPAPAAEAELFPVEKSTRPKVRGETKVAQVAQEDLLGGLAEAKVKGEAERAQTKMDLGNLLQAINAMPDNSTSRVVPGAATPVTDKKSGYVSSPNWIRKPGFKARAQSVFNKFFPQVAIVEYAPGQSFNGSVVLSFKPTDGYGYRIFLHELGHALANINPGIFTAADVRAELDAIAEDSFYINTVLEGKGSEYTLSPGEVIAEFNAARFALPELNTRFPVLAAALDSAVEQTPSLNKLSQAEADTLSAKVASARAVALNDIGGKSGSAFDRQYARIVQAADSTDIDFIRTVMEEVKTPFTDPSTGEQYPWTRASFTRRIESQIAEGSIDAELIVRLNQSKAEKPKPTTPKDELVSEQRDEPPAAEPGAATAGEPAAVTEEEPTPVQDRPVEEVPAAPAAEPAAADQGGAAVAATEEVAPPAAVKPTQAMDSAKAERKARYDAKRAELAEKAKRLSKELGTAADVLNRVIVTKGSIPFFDPEVFKALSDVATGASKLGIVRFEEFAALIKYQFPQFWDSIKEILSAVWNAATRADRTLRETPSNAEVDRIIADLDEFDDMDAEAEVVPADTTTTTTEEVAADEGKVEPVDTGKTISEDTAAAQGAADTFVPPSEGDGPPSEADLLQNVGFGKFRSDSVRDATLRDPQFMFERLFSDVEMAQTLAGKNADRLRQVRGVVRRMKGYQEYQRVLNMSPEQVAAENTELADELDQTVADLQGNGFTVDVRPDGLAIIRLTPEQKTQYEDIIRSNNILWSNQFSAFVSGFSRNVIAFGRDVSDRMAGRPVAYERAAEQTEARVTADRIRAELAQADDESVLDAKEVNTFVNQATRKKLYAGVDMGIPLDIYNEQVYDAALIGKAHKDKKPMFLLASQPGSGKTFVIGASIERMKKQGAKKIIYVTRNQELIGQIKKDLNAYDIDGVEFMTYAALDDAVKNPAEDTDAIIFDEAHEVRYSVSGDASKRAIKAGEWMNKSKFTVLASATPYEDLEQMRYLWAAGAFQPFARKDLRGDAEKGWYGFAEVLGGEVRLKDGEPTGVKFPEDTAKLREMRFASREYLRKRGMFSQRKLRIPAEMIRSFFPAVAAKPEWVMMFDATVEALAGVKGANNNLKAFVTNLQKRILEASKQEAAVKLARQKVAAGKRTVIFVETRSENERDLPEIVAAYQAWVESGRDPETKPEIVPDIPNIDKFFEKLIELGIDEIKFPSAQDYFKETLGDLGVVFYTGNESGKQGETSLSKWNSGEAPVMVATMARGGTGLSLHDKLGVANGGAERAQIMLNLPWRASEVEQVAGRTARYGMKSVTEIYWLFTQDIEFDRKLAQKVGNRMASMNVLVQGDITPSATIVTNYDLQTAEDIDKNTEDRDQVGDELTPEQAAAVAELNTSEMSIVYTEEDNTYLKMVEDNKITQKTSMAAWEVKPKSRLAIAGMRSMLANAGVPNDAPLVAWDEDGKVIPPSLRGQAEPADIRQSAAPSLSPVYGLVKRTLTMKDKLQVKEALRILRKAIPQIDSLVTVDSRENLLKRDDLTEAEKAALGSPNFAQGIYSNGRVFVAFNNVVRTDKHASEAAAIAGTIVHELMHKGAAIMRLSPDLAPVYASWKSMLDAHVNDGDLTVLVNSGYPGYAEWRSNSAIREKAQEEVFVKRIEALFHKGDLLTDAEKTLMQRFLSFIRSMVNRLLGKEMSMEDEVVQRWGRFFVVATANRHISLDGSGGLMTSFIGERAIENMPEERKQFMRDSLDTAKAMAAAGKSSEEIRAVTGWFQGLDKKMRWEVPDNGAVLNTEQIDKTMRVWGSTGPFRLVDVLDHPQLFEAYPKLRYVVTSIKYGPEVREAQGSFGSRGITAAGKTADEALDTLLHEVQHWVQEQEGFAVGGSPDNLIRPADFTDAAQFRDAQRGIKKYEEQILTLKRLRDEEKAKKGFLGIGGPNKNQIDDYNKKVDEAVANIESIWEYQASQKRPKGGTRAALLAAMNRVEDELGSTWGIARATKDAGLVRIYQLLAGEIEARDVEARRSMTDEQRKATAPYSSENIAPEDAIVMFGGGGVMASMGRSPQAIRHAELEAKFNAGTITPEETAEAEKLVEEVAKAAGYDMKAYHGTNAPDITTFKKRGVSTNFNNAQRLIGYFFASDQKYAAQYGKNVMPVFLKGNFSEEPASAIDRIENGGDSNAKQWKKRRADKGFTGVKFGSGNSEEIAVFDPNQIKSAEPFTGVPLDQRFDIASPDIRQSMAPGESPRDGADEPRPASLFSTYITPVEAEAVKAAAARMDAAKAGGDDPLAKFARQQVLGQAGVGMVYKQQQLGPQQEFAMNYIGFTENASGLPEVNAAATKKAKSIALDLLNPNSFFAMRYQEEAGNYDAAAAVLQLELTRYAIAMLAKGDASLLSTVRRNWNNIIMGKYLTMASAGRLLQARSHYTGVVATTLDEMTAAQNKAALKLLKEQKAKDPIRTLQDLENAVANALPDYSALWDALGKGKGIPAPNGNPDLNWLDKAMSALDSHSKQLFSSLMRRMALKAKMLDARSKMKDDDIRRSVPDWMGELDNIELPTDPAELDKLMAQNDAEIANLLGQLTGSTTDGQLPPEIKKVLDDNAPKVKRKPVAAKPPMDKDAPGVIPPEKQKEINDAIAEVDSLEQEGDTKSTEAAIAKLTQLLADLAKVPSPTVPSDSIIAKIRRIVAEHIRNGENVAYSDFYDSMTEDFEGLADEVGETIREDIQEQLIQATWQTFDQAANKTAQDMLAQMKSIKDITYGKPDQARQVKKEVRAAIVNRDGLTEIPLKKRLTDALVALKVEKDVATELAEEAYGQSVRYAAKRLALRTAKITESMAAGGNKRMLAAMAKASPDMVSDPTWQHNAVRSVFEASGFSFEDAEIAATNAASRFDDIFTNSGIRFERNAKKRMEDAVVRLIDKYAALQSDTPSLKKAAALRKRNIEDLFRQQVRVPITFKDDKGAAGFETLAMAMGATRQQAMILFHEAETETRYNQQRGTDRLIQTKLIEFIKLKTSAELNEPGLRDTMVEAFLKSNGFTPEQIREVKPNILNNLEKYLGEARSAAITRILKQNAAYKKALEAKDTSFMTEAEKQLKKTLERIRLGIADTTSSVAEVLAGSLEEPVKFLKTDMVTLAQLDSRITAAQNDGRTHDAAIAIKELYELLARRRQSTGFLERLGIAYNNSALSGIATLGINLYGPVGSMMTRVSIDLLRAVKNKDWDAISLVFNSLADTFSNAYAEGALAIRGDAYTNAMQRVILKVNNLRQGAIKATETLKDKGAKPWDRVKALGVVVQSYTDITRRILSTADQTWFSTMQGYFYKLQASKALINNKMPLPMVQKAVFDITEKTALKIKNDKAMIDTYASRVEALRGKPEEEFRAGINAIVRDTSYLDDDSVSLADEVREYRTTMDNELRSIIRAAALPYKKRPDLAVDKVLKELKLQKLAVDLRQRDLVVKDIDDLLKERFGEAEAKRIKTFAEKESEYEIGNHKGEAGSQLDIFNQFSLLIQNAGYSVIQKNPILGRMLLGYFGVPVNLLNRSLWYTPYGLLRYAAAKRMEGIGLPNGEFYRQSMETAEQMKQRFSEAILGTSVFAFAIALQALGDDDEEELFNVTLAGPTNKTEYDAWVKNGHRKGAIEMNLGGKVYSVNWARGLFEPWKPAFVAMGAYDDMKLNRKLGDKENEVAVINYLGAAMSGWSQQASFFGAKTTIGSTFSANPDTNMLGTLAYKASPLIPFSGLLNSISKFYTGPNTYRGREGAIWANIPVASMFATNRAVNALGDPVGVTGNPIEVANDRAWYAGMPLNVGGNLTGNDAKIYEFILERGTGPGIPQRSAIETKNGFITDAEFLDYVSYRGRIVKTKMLRDLPKLRAMNDESLSKAIGDISSDATSEAKKRFRYK